VVLGKKYYPNLELVDTPSVLACFFAWTVFYVKRDPAGVSSSQGASHRADLINPNFLKDSSLGISLCPITTHPLVTIVLSLWASSKLGKAKIFAGMYG
jgi:hypothetical protein